jgi:hypothetical protein
MKKRKLLLGVLVIVLVFGMTVVGCDGDAGDPKSITITGITGINQGCDEVSILVISGFNGNDPIPVAMGINENNYAGEASVTLDLLNTKSFKLWTDSGSFYLFLLFEERGNSNNKNAYFYTDGAPFTGVDSCVKFNITSKNSKIALDKFK